MRPDWPIVVKSLTDQKVRVYIITNGYLFSEKMLADLKQLNVESMVVSVDGTEIIHDKYRQKGSFQRAMNAIDVLTENNIPVSVISTLHSGNIHSLAAMYEILKHKNIYAWQLQACSPMGNASDDNFSVSIDFIDAIRFVEEHMFQSDFAIGIADNIGYYTENEGYLRGNLSGIACFRGCKADLSVIGIDSVGNVRGCESMYDEYFIEGNLREKSLKVIWHNPNAFAYNRQFTVDKLSGKCSTCQYGKICAGGCRPYNYFTHRKLYEPPGCARLQTVGQNV